MSYEGEELTFCPETPFDFSKASAVIVSGTPPNFAGHMLLYTGGDHPQYFQVIGKIKAVPRYMDEDGYQRYIQENGKKELRRIPVVIPHPEASQLKLEQILSMNWFWGAVVHNCETMVEEIITSGGGPKLSNGLPFPIWAHPILPTRSNVKWTCGSLKCPTHDRKKDQCREGTGVWLCRCRIPACPSHRSPDDECPGGTAWTCGALSCPAHARKGDHCAKGVGVWTCRRAVPPCPSHSSPHDSCPEPWW